MRRRPDTGKIPEEQANLTYIAESTPKDFHYSNEFVRGIMGPVGCLPADTEYLSPVGWKSIGSYSSSSGDELVAEWENGMLRFRHPKSFVDLPCDEFIEFKNEHALHMVLSEEHKVPLYDYRGTWRVKTAAALEKEPSRYTVPINFCVNTRGCILLNEQELRLGVAIKADGHFPKAGKQCIVTLRKERKKKRLRELLVGIEYREVNSNIRPTETRFSFIPPKDILCSKTYADWWGASQLQLGFIFDEVRYWDGLFEGPDTRFSTTCKEDADFIQYVTHSVGGRATISKEEYPENPNWLPGYIVHIAPPGSVKASVGFRGDGMTVSRVPSTDGRMYCFETKSGFFLARHNGRIFVTGNSGKTTACIMELYTRALEQKAFNGVRRSRWALIRTTYPELLSTTLKTFEEWIPHEICPIVHSSPIHGLLQVSLPDSTKVEAEFLFLALDQEEDVKKLRSLELTGAFINEASETREAVLKMLTSRVDRYPSKKSMGGVTWSGIVMDTNPPNDNHWWYRLAEIEKPQGYRFWRQPPALIKAFDEDKMPIYVPNDGTHPGILQAENIDNHNSGFNYYLRMIPGKDQEWIKVFVLGEYGSIFNGRPVYPEYSDTTHCAKEELKPYRGLPLVLTWDFGLCYSKDTEVLTRDGWKFFKDVEVDSDWVATRDPSDGSFQYVRPNFKVDRPYKGKMLEWANSSVNFCVTPEHRVPYTERNTPDVVRWTSAEGLASQMTAHRYVDLTSVWEQPDDAAVRFGMSSDTFAEFMGLYLSEGCVVKADVKRGHGITIYQKADDPFFARILGETGLGWKRQTECWRTSHKDLADYLRLFGTSHHKYIPQEIKTMSARQIRMFIMAFTAGDGHIRTRDNGAVEHTLFTTSETMAGEFQELAQKAGWNSSLRVVQPQVSTICEDGEPRDIQNSGGFSVTFKKRASRAELLPEAFQEIDYDGRIYCLNVPFHTLYVRRNGRPSWNGNTPSCVIMQMTPKGQLRVLDELYSESMGIERFSRDIVRPFLSTEKYQGMLYQSVGDPAGSQRVQTNEVTCLQMLEMQGFKTESAPTNSFIPRREAVAWFLTKMIDGEPGFQLSPQCQILRKGFMGGYQYRRMKIAGAGDRYAETPDKNEFSHTQDCVQYGCSFLRSASRDAGTGGLGASFGSRRREMQPKNFGAWS